MVWVAMCYSYGGCGGSFTNGCRCLVHQISESDFVAGRKRLTCGSYPGRCLVPLLACCTTYDAFAACYNFNQKKSTRIAALIFFAAY